MLAADLIRRQGPSWLHNSVFPISWTAATSQPGAYRHGRGDSEQKGVSSDSPQVSGTIGCGEDARDSRWSVNVPFPLWGGTK